jgi:hypothetical protein
MGRFKTQVITRRDDVPEGYANLRLFVTRGDGTIDKTLAKALSEAHTNGMLPAVKLFRSASDWKTGPVFLDRDAAERFVAEWHAARTPRPASVPVVDEQATAPTVTAMEELRLAIVSLAADVRNLQAAVELRAEITA